MRNNYTETLLYNLIFCPYAKNIFYIALLLLTIEATVAQNVVADSIQKTDSVSHTPFNYKQLIIPGVLIGYGVIGLESDQLKSFNTEIREEVQENIDEKLTIDDFSQYAPALSVYALNASGVKGKHNFRDVTIILVTSYTIMCVSVLSLKSITKEERPDGTSNNSFPSGHTATAFAGAELLYQEYKKTSPWIGVAGYAVAAGTGLFRIYNNRHWLTDVAAGAGIGILSTKIAYWIHPWINEKLLEMASSKECKSSWSFAPLYDGTHTGGMVVIQF